MSKEALKIQISELKGHICHISQQPIPALPRLFDTHRSIPKAEGGLYTEENTNLADPMAHMVKHGNYRERPEEVEQLKVRLDDRRQIMKLQNKLNNQLLAYKRGTDTPDQKTIDFIGEQLKSAQKELQSRDREIAKYVKKMEDPLVQAALTVKGIGEITVAHCAAYIDVAKARHASSLWSYVGLDKPSHERYQKGVAGGGNKTLRTVLYTMADSQIKTRGPYREVYDNTKHRLENSDRLVWSRNTQGQLVEIPWKETKPSHRHGAAIRKLIKHFLADWWYVGRTLKGLNTTPIYAEAVLGGQHRTIKPEERGWIY